jgi:DeoR/GlpR family transcriptional regulator of sugar metabolism
MLTEPRKQHILKVLQRDGQVIAKAISEELGLSEDTIRRDLRELAQAGRLQRVHGGALPASPAVADFKGRALLATDEKIAIARVAARMIRPGQVVILDGGTTTQQLARQLPPDLAATIVTHSPTIAVELAAHPTVEVVLIGGRLFKHSVVAVGAPAIEAIGRIRADTYFMGVTGIHPEAGLSTGDLEEAYVKRALSASAADIIVLASSEKLHAASPYVIGPTSDVTELITGRNVPPSATSAFERLGLKVTRA